MKNNFKKYLLLISFIVIASIFTACSKKVVSENTTVNSIFEMLVYNNPNFSEDIGMSKEDAQLLIDKNVQITLESFKNIFKTNGLDITDEKIQKLYEAQLEKLKETSFTIDKSTRLNGNTKRIEILTTSIPSNIINENAVSKFIEEFSKGEITNSSKSGEILCDIMIEEYKNAKLNQEKSRFTEEFSKQKFKGTKGETLEVWAPTNFQNFIQKLLISVTFVFNE